MPKRKGYISVGAKRPREDVDEEDASRGAHLHEIGAIKANIDKYELIIKCIEKTIAKQRNLIDKEYNALFKDANIQGGHVDTEFVRMFTSFPPFTPEMAKQDLQKAKQDLKDAETKLKDAKLEKGKGKKVEGVRTSVVEAALPSMPEKAYTMVELPDVCPNVKMKGKHILVQKKQMKEVVVVKIRHPYFERIASLYVRMRYYPPLWEEIKEKLSSPSKEFMDLTIVIGQPGIGKSVGFGNYCVLRSMLDLTNTIVIVIMSTEVHVLVPRGKSWEQFTFESYPHMKDLEVCALIETLGVREHNALVVHDIKSAKGDVVFALQDDFLKRLQDHVSNVHTVVLTSPQESNFGIAKKVGLSIDKYLPVWSKDELESAESFDVQGKYEYCGGVPRSYRSSIKNITKAQAKASRTFDPSLMGSVELSGKCPSELVKLDIDEDCDTCIGLSPVSMSAERLLRSSFFTQVSNQYHDRVQRSIGTEKGLLLEKWFLFWIRGSENVAITCNIVNFPDRAKDVLTVSPQCWVQVGKNTFKELLDAAKAVPNLQDGQSVFVQPTNTSFPVVDLLYFTKTGNATWEVDAFQVTVSSAHAPKSEPAKKLNELSTSGCTLRRFIWVGLTGVSWSLDPSCGVCSAQKVNDGTAFFEGKQCRLDMSQLVAKTSISS